MTIMLSAPGEAVLLGNRGSGNSYERADIPEFSIGFPTSRFVLPSAIQDIGHQAPFVARIRGFLGREEVFNPADNPNDEMHQQGFAYALNTVTAALLRKNSK